MGSSARGAPRHPPARAGDKQGECQTVCEMAHGAWWVLLPLLALASASPQSNYDLQALSTEYQGGPQTFPEFATLNGTVIEPGNSRLQRWIHVCPAAVQAGVLWDCVRRLRQELCLQGQWQRWRNCQDPTPSQGMRNSAVANEGVHQQYRRPFPPGPR